MKCSYYFISVELKFSNVGSWEMDTRVLGNEWGFRQIPFHLITGFFTMYSVWLNVRTEPWFENSGFKSDSPFLTVCLRAKSLIFLSTSPLENEEITALMGFINPWNGEYTSNCLHEQVQFQQTLVELMKRFFFFWAILVPLPTAIIARAHPLCLAGWPNNCMCLKNCVWPALDSRKRP